MKKKLTLFLVMVMALVCVFAVSVFADSVHANVDKTQTVTLSDGTVLNLFDANGNALIWYKDANSETGYSSVRADSGAGEEGYTGGTVVINQSYQFSVGNSTVGTKTAYECNGITITVGGSTVDKGNIVVFNVMDDDALTSKGNPFNCFKDIFWSSSNLQYAYLRLDTVAIQANALNACANLKYVNLEDLTELRQLAGSTFNKCTSLFSGQVLDLTGTKLVSIGGNAVFAYLPIVGLKLPKTVTSIGDWCIQGAAITTFTFPTGVATIGGSQFNDCTSLKEIYINNTTTKISDRAFNNTILEKIFFVGTEDELTALLDNTGANNNAPFWNVVGENRENIISYTDYLALEDKSGNYVVYDYSYCEAYLEGEHTISGANPCVGTCGVCKLEFIKHSESAAIIVEISYSDFTKAGEKVSRCENEGCTHRNAEPVPAIFVNNGYSYSGTAILQGFAVNLEALGAYEEATGKTLQYGLAVASVAKLGATNTLFDGTTLKAGAFSASFDDKKQYSIFEMQVTGLVDDYKDTELFVCAYVIDGDTVTYISNGANTTTVEAVTYNQVVANAEANQTTDIIVNKEENV